MRCPDSEPATWAHPRSRGENATACPISVEKRAHPRSRGENTLQSRYAWRRAGSSPLTRGKPVSLNGRQRRQRLIPAHAGKTQVARPIRGLRWAHPRSRGENPSAVQICVGALGSSPLTRGKPRGQRATVGAAGLIPAHAGKTDERQYIRVDSRAHPRSRGENEVPGHGAAGEAGSSPLTRGKPGTITRETPIAGLIPAHAGKTPRATRRPPWTSAHPRSRGENARRGGPITSGPGSSPLTRGKPHPGIEDAARPRLIPAHAGKTSCSWWFVLTNRAHPRSRGENETDAGIEIEARGSSPLTRGKRTKQRTQLLIFGLIPAHAGKTFRRAGQSRYRRAHPRSRGENICKSSPSAACSGSSPLTRGKRWYVRPCPSTAGLIPAHAGKTSNSLGRS